MDRGAINFLKELGFHDFEISNLDRTVTLLDDNDEDYKHLQKYFNESAAWKFTPKLISAVKLGPDKLLLKNKSSSRFDQSVSLLCHGTLNEHIKGILQDGIKCSKSKGNRFGACIYLTNRVGKACLFSKGGGRGDTEPDMRSNGYLIFFQTYLGSIYNYNGNKKDFKGPPRIRTHAGVLKYDSIRVLGQRTPDTRGNIIDHRFITWPIGKTCVPERPATMYFDEFLVFNEKAVAPLFIAKFKKTK